MSADTGFKVALAALAAALREIAAPSMIIGGVAVIAAGVPRQTIDIDATILGSASDPKEVIATLERHGITPRIDDALQFARERAIELDLHGVRTRIASPEDLVIYKAAAWRDRDRSDIERLLILHGGSIDLERVRPLVVAIATALEDSDRVAAFDAIVARTRKPLA